METPSTSTELINDEHKRDTRGRRITEPRRKAEVIAGYASSGLTQKAYARREGVNYHTLVSWLGQSRRNRDPRPSPALETEVNAPRFAQLTWPPALSSAQPSAPSASRLEVVLPDGVILRGEDPSALVILLRALAALSPRRPC